MHTSRSDASRKPSRQPHQHTAREWLRIGWRWLPASIGLAVGVVVLLAVDVWTPWDWTTIGLPLLALAYLVFGAARGQLRRPGVLALQTAGLVGFTVPAVVALLVDPAVGHYVVAAGWFGHAAWDVAHHRDLSQLFAVGVVPRGYAEFCIVVDLLVGASLIMAAPTL